MKKIVIILVALIMLLSGCSSIESNKTTETDRPVGTTLGSEGVPVEEGETLTQGPSIQVDTTDLNKNTIPEETTVSKQDVTTQETTQAGQISTTIPTEPTKVPEEPTTHLWEDPTFSYPPNDTPIF